MESSNLRQIVLFEMGKRKERRQAAMNAVGRRVKLDLFAEPSGDLVGSSQDDVRGEIHSNNHAELRNSPSSSGHQLENPLMLLEQYSDDELVALDEQGKVSFREENKDGKGFISSAPMKGKDEEKDSASEHILQIAEKCGHKERDVVYPDESLKENDETSESTTLDGVISGWKVLMHEESNQYYYWNVSTGETSWEVPSILIPTVDIRNDEKATYDIYVENANFKTSEYHANWNTQLKDYNPGETCDGSNVTHEDKMVNKEYKFNALHGKGVDGDGDLKEMKNMSGQLQSNIGISFLASDSFKHSGDSLSNHSSKSGEDAEKLGDVPSAEEVEVQADFSSNLVEQCRSLLQKLKAMQWSQKCLQGHDQISKYMVEVDIRLADIMSLACNGFSLLPFWVHSEKRLKLLEAAIDEIPVLSNCLHSYDADDLNTSHHETSDETKMHANENIAIHHSCREVYASEYAGSLESRKDAYAEALNGAATNNSGRNALDEGEFLEHAAHEELSPDTMHLGEDVDMELDMEVEDIPLNSSIMDPSFGQNHIDHGKDLVQALPSNEGPYFLEHASSVLSPPPYKEWVPPPPPDDEPFPPPPPDEPPEAAYSQLSDLQSVQPFPCTVSYPVSGYGFYDQMDNVPSTSNVYSHADGQAAVSHQHLYYEAIANAYSSDPMEANTVDPHAYYSFQGGSEQHVPVAVTANSSVHPSGSINEALSDTTASSSTSIQVSSVFSIQNKCDGVVDVTPVGISLNFPAAQATFEKSNTVIASATLLGSSDCSITAPATSVASASNIPPKVSRNKKRTVSTGSKLRLNKKVSNLVDKWKAAKEELAEVEEEPVSAYEILEKKRHREIEEWRAKLIASGEAKDNANFQPLGGDWRERVKQKRAEKLKEAEPRATATDGAGESHQFDLTALSIGLPSGWQVYFDESSKQVYYGNITTLETTWSRPTN